MSSFKVTVLFFAKSRELAGGRNQVEFAISELSCELSKFINERLLKEFPALSEILDSCSFAVNASYVEDAQHVLRSGDTVAIIPPISGG